MTSKISTKTINNHWNAFYNKNKRFRNSPFSKFALNHMKENKRLLDIGCGNARDSIFFTKNQVCVTGIDLSNTAIKNNNRLCKIFPKNKINFICKDFIKHKLNFKKKFDYIYSRFFLHTINKKSEKIFLKKIKKIAKKNAKIFLEFRTTKDSTFNKGKKLSNNESIYGHYRRFIEVNEFKKDLKKMGIKIIFLKQSNKFSIFKNQKPHLARMILKN